VTVRGPAQLDAVESMFAWLREKGIEVSVRPDEDG